MKWSEQGQRARTALESQLNLRGLVARHTEFAALRTLHEVMTVNEWTALQVDIEDHSVIDTLTLADGQRWHLGADNELDAINDELFEIVGTCPRSLFTYRDGEYWADLDDIRAAITGTFRAQLPSTWEAPPI